ncbi:hypothetical protein HPB52_015217 [Rhipicephalus sanguineus]|uniref:Protein kinase domain-containing protein n=1 Tax=Rhipicephalus sanguineus TaxID=34632 RepID=A0A9D4YQD4_RHISA|nr:hypothetical protein HPB52_015217 [Rhipicephalus sanguineus]
MVTDGGSPSLRRVQSDPALNSPKAKTAAKQKLAFLESNSFGKTVTDEACEMCRTSQAADSPTVPMEAETNSGLRCEKRPINDDSNANQEERVTQIAGQNKDAFAPGQTKRKLGCHRLHYLQEHLFREIIRSRQMKHPEDNRDASSTAMALVETMLRALNSLLQKPVYKANASLDPRIESKPLFTVDSGAVDLYAQTDGKDPQSAEEAFNRELLKADGAWSNSFAYVAAREIAYDDQATLSSVWLAESQRWRKAFLDVANSPLSSLAAVNGFFYSEEKSNFLAGARINERTTVHLGIAKNGREVLLKKIKFHPKDFESALVRVLNFKKLDLYHGNINESHVTWKSSSSLVYVLWHPQDRNLEQYMALLRERKLSLVKWGRVAMGQLLDALAFLHTRREPIVHGRLKVNVVAGMLIYFMLTGAHPFGKCDDDCQVNIARGRVLARPVNTELDDLAHHLLALEPEYRLTASSAIRTTEGILRQFNLACGSFNNWTSRVPQGVLKDAFPNIDPPQDALGLLMLIKRCTLDYDTMSPEAQRALKQPERFFVETFPGFLMAVHGVVRRIHWRYSPTIEAFF